MRISPNINALYTNKQLQRTERKLDKVSRELSSGIKINNASDGPVEYAVGSKLRTQLAGLQQASSNVTDGKSVTSIVDGVLGEITDMIQRIKELAVQAGSESYSDADRASLNSEAQQLLKEIDSLSKNTQFNNRNLLDGSFDLRGYTNNSNVSILTYSDEVKVGVYDVNFSNMFSMSSSEITVNMNSVQSVFADARSGSLKGNVLSLTGVNNFELKIKFNNFTFESNSDKMSYFSSLTNVEVNISGYGAMVLQTGANANQTMNLRIPNMSLESIGIKDVDLSTIEKALDSLKVLEEGLEYVNSARSRMGAYNNRLDYHYNSLLYQIDNLTASYSNIMDTQIESSMVEYSSLKIMQDTGLNMLKQLNDTEAKVLELLA